MTPVFRASQLALMAESQLIELARAGTVEAFEELVRRRQSTTRHLLRRICRDAARADDLSQEVFLLAWRQIKDLRSSAAFGGWLRQITVRAGLRYLKRGEHAELGDISSNDLAIEHTDSERLDLDAALAQLEADVRLCIVLSYQAEMSHGEIASATDIPLGTVKSHIARGTKRLKESLVAYAHPRKRVSL